MVNIKHEKKFVSGDAVKIDVPTLGILKARWRNQQSRKLLQIIWAVST